jgi:WD40 repeat protein
MKDIAISYDSTHRSAAQRLEASLKAAGLTVWMDDAADEAPEEAGDIGLVGIAVGASHRAVVVEEIEGASAVVILDSPRWRSSEYCRWEYAQALKAGKRIAVLPAAWDEPEAATAGEPGSDAPQPELAETSGEETWSGWPVPEATWPVAGLDDLLDRFGVGLARAEAHSRLIEAERGLDYAAASGRPSEGLLADARLILDQTGTEENGLRPSPALLGFAQSVVGAQTRWSRRRNLAATAAVCAICVLAVTSGVAWRVAAAQSERAVSAANAQQSLLLAQESRNSTNTFEQLRLAEQAVATDATAEATAALAAARAQRAQFDLFTIPGRTYVEAALSADGRVLVVTSQQQVVQVDLAAGEELAVVEPVEAVSGRALAITADGAQAVVANAQGQLTEIDFAAKRSGSIAGITAQAFTVDSQGTLWWLDEEGIVGHRSFPWSESATVTAFDVEILASAIHVSSGADEVALLGEDGHLRRYSVAGEQLTDAEMLPPELVSQTVLAHNYGWVDRLIRCDDSWVAHRQGALSLLLDGSDEPLQINAGPSLADRNSVAGRMVAVLNRPACVGGGVVYMQSYSTFSDMLPEGLPNPVRPILRASSGDGVTSAASTTSRAGGYAIAGTPDGSRIVLVSMDGQVISLAPEHAARSRTSPERFLPLPLDTGMYFYAPTGAIYDAATWQEVGALPGVPSLSASVVSGGAGYVSLDATGQVARVQRDVISGPVVDVCSLPADVAARNWSIAASPEGPVTLFSGSAYGVLRWPDPASGTECDVVLSEVPELSGGERVWSASLSSNGELVLVTTSHSRLLVVDEGDNSLVAETRIGVGAVTTNAAFLPDGSIVALGGDGHLVVLGADLDVHLAQITGRVRNSLLSQDGTRLAVEDVNAVVTLYDTATLAVLQTFPGVVSNDTYNYIALDSTGRTLWRAGFSQSQDEDGNVTINGGTVTAYAVVT